MAAMKVLLCGSVAGKFQQWYRRIASVNKTNGPFDLVLCTGNPLPENETELRTALEELKTLIEDGKLISVPVYFVGISQSTTAALQTVLRHESGDNASHIHVLEGSGLHSITGFSVAHIRSDLSKDEKNSLLKDVESASGDIDFLLTDTWPEKITAMCAPDSLPQGIQGSGSREIAELALKVRPRYLIASGPVFFARLPYLNKDLGAGSHVTRFIGLADVGNAGKQKWVHALGLQPASEMDAETLQQKPAGTTPCPFIASQKRPAETQANGQAWRWEEQKRSKSSRFNLGGPDLVQDDRRTVYVGNLPYAAEDDDIAEFLQQCGEVEDVRRGMTNGKPNTYAFVQFKSIEAAGRACELADASMMGRQLRLDSVRKQQAAPSGDPVQGCWFCLSSERADVNLIVSIGEEMYVAMDKGPINKHHVLLLPIEHRANSLALSSAAYLELERYLSALRTCFASQGRQLLAFERYMLFKSKGGNHLQFNVLSIPAGAASNIKTAYLAIAGQNDLTFKAIDGPQQGEEGRSALRDAVGDGEYFQVIFPDGSRMVHTVRPGQKHHLPFGREAAASVAGVPARADWKSCQVDADKEEQLTGEFKALFKSYDIMAT